MALTERLAYIINADGRGAVTEFSKVGDAADKELGRAESRIDRIGEGFTKAGAVMLTAGGVAAAGLYKVGQAASSEEQSIGAVESVFGNASESILQFGEDASQTAGLSRREVNEMAAVIGASLQGMGFEADEAAEKTILLETRAADMAATFGGTTKEAIDAVASALRGERDPIERFGVSIKQADVNARILALGLDTSSAAAKKNAEAVATLDIIMSKTALTEGQFAREADSAAGAQARLQAEWENAQATLGEAVLPLLAKGADMLGGFLKAWENLGEGTQSAIGTLAVAGTGIALVGGAVSTVVGQLIRMRNVMKPAAVKEFFTNMSRGAKIATGATLALVAAYALYDRALSKQREGMGSFNEAVERSLNTTGKSTDQLREKVDALRQGADDLNEAQSGGPAGFLWDRDKNQVLQEGAEKANAAADELETILSVAERLAPKLGITADEVLRLAEANGVDLSQGADAAEGALSDVATEAGSMERAVDDASESTKDFEGAVKGLKDAIDDLLSSTFDEQEAADAWFDTMQDLESSLADTTGEIEGMSEGARTNRAALRDLVTDGLRWQQTMLEQGASAGEVNRKIAEQRRHLEEVGRRYGLTREQLQPYIDALGGIPGEVVTNIIANVEGLEKVERLVNALGTGTVHLGGGNRVQIVNGAPVGLAHGTPNWRGGMALVGERGPELVNLPRGSEVIPNRETEQILGGRDAPSLTVQMFGNSPREVIDEFQWRFG